MVNALDRFLSARSRVALAATSLLLVAIIGVIDHLTGYELAFSIFYVVPVGISSWYAGKRLGIAVCIISAATWVMVDFTSGHQYSHLTVPFWNGCVRFGFFIIISHLLWRFRGVLEVQSTLAQQDGLTGVMNARAFRQRCELVARLAARYGRPMALGYLDLDGFKGINDVLGHDVGDLVLREVANEVGRRLRASDVVGRLGGDEFGILLPETDLAGARMLFTEMRANLIDLAARNRWPVGLSIGVAVFDSPPATLDDGIRRADDLMYKVKGAGKNGILFEEYAGGSRGA
jgi:diguanylate cyclase (GGDEF)-like protein